MSAHAPPDDVRTVQAASSVLERGSPIGSPGHLEDGICALHPLHPQPCPEMTGAQVDDEGAGDLSEASPLIHG